MFVSVMVKHEWVHSYSTQSWNLIRAVLCKITPRSVQSELWERYVIVFMYSDHCKPITLRFDLSVWKPVVAYYFYSLKGHTKRLVNCSLFSMKVTSKWLVYRPSSWISLNCLILGNIKNLHPLSRCLTPSLHHRKDSMTVCESIIRFGSAARHGISTDSTVEAKNVSMKVMGKGFHFSDFRQT